MKMISPVTVETINNLAPNAGMLLFDFDFSSAVDAQSLATLVTDKHENWLGATKGGINVQENREWWSPEFDGKRMAYKGEKQFANAQPRVTGTLVEFTPKNVKNVSGIANITGEETNVITVQPRASIELGDYHQNIVWVTNNGPEGLYLVELKNALCTSGMNSQSTDKDIGTLPFEFSGHAENVEWSDELPIRYLFYRAAKTEQAQTTEQTEQQEG